MIHAITLPKLGQMTEESSISKWLKQEGDAVQNGEILFEMETDKAVMEVNSFFEGTLLKIVVPEGKTVPVTSVVAYVGDPRDAIPNIATPRAEITDRRVDPSPKEAAHPKLEERAVTGQAAPALFRISPRAVRLVQESAIDPAPVMGTGAGCRVVERDIRAYLETRNYGQLRVTPAAKKRAQQENLDLLTLRGTGDSGRIVLADIERTLSEQPRPMSRMRQAIAQRVTESFTTAPHFFVTVSADVTELWRLRAEHKGGGAPYTINDFILKAVALTLTEFPALNSSTDGKLVRSYCGIHLGLAVALDEGLMVPVIRDADQLNLEEIHHCASDLVARAHDGKLRPDDLKGSTFTVSNMGMMDVENFTAIINPGESGILAVSSAVEQPAVRGGLMTIRRLMKMTLSADHRIVDGALAARFVAAIKGRLEDIALWKRLV